MKLILIIQTIIILAGAYYVYTLSNPKTTSEITVEVVETPVPEERIEEAITTEAEDSERAVIETRGAGTDVGMEFPVPD